MLPKRFKHANATQSKKINNVKVGHLPNKNGSEMRTFWFHSITETSVVPKIPKRRKTNESDE